MKDENIKSPGLPQVAHAGQANLIYLHREISIPTIMRGSKALFTEIWLPILKGIPFKILTSCPLSKTAIEIPPCTAIKKTNEIEWFGSKIKFKQNPLSYDKHIYIPIKIYWI